MAGGSPRSGGGSAGRIVSGRHAQTDLVNHHALAYFGYPEAHEDDARRAVHAGLGIVEAMGRLNVRLERDRSLRLAVRLGIHTGQVVTGEVGAGARREQLALGQAPNVAARLQGLAGPDQVLLSDATHQLVRGFFDCQELGERSLKGVSQPMAVYRAVRESGVRTRLAVAEKRGLTPLVGRTTELGLLRERYAHVRGGRGQVVLVTGEAGIGKSRLLRAFREELALEAPHWLFCDGSPYHSNSAFHPVIELLEKLFRLHRDDSPEQRLGKLEEGLRRFSSPLAETVPLLAALLSLGVPDKYPSLRLSPEYQKSKTLELVLTVLLEMGDEQPVVFVMEDLHWVDPSSLEFLELLMGQSPMTRILILLTARPSFHPPWGTRSHLTQLTLDRLADGQVEAMVRTMAGGEILPDGVLGRIVERTDGIPLFVEELTKVVLTSGLASAVIPATVRDSLMARLDRLGNAKEVAQLASVVGRGFTYEMLAAVSQLPEVRLREELARLVEAELIYQRGVPPSATYAFKHALIRDTAYRSLLKVARQRCHGKVARVIERSFPETVETQPELLAHHYTEARRLEPAIEYWQRAAKGAFQQSAIVEATAHLRRGTALLDDLPEGAQRDAWELTLMTDLGAALSATIGAAAPEVHQAYQRALELCQRREEAPELFWVLCGLSRFHYARSNHEKGLELGYRLVRLSASQQEGAQEDVVRRIAAHWSLGAALFMVGEFTSAHDYVEQGIGFDCLDRDRPITSQTEGDCGVVLLGWSARCLWFLGYPERAVERQDQMLDFAERISHPLSVTYSLNYGIHLSYYRRDRARLLEQGQKELTLSRQQGSWMELSAQICLGWARTMEGDVEEGIKGVRDGIDSWVAIGTRTHLPQFLLMLAEASARRGLVDDGKRILREVLDLMQSTGERFLEAEAHRLQGELELTAKADSEAVLEKQQRHAESSFKRALAVARRQNAKSLELRAANCLSRLWVRQGQRHQARELLEEIYGWFTEGFDTQDLQEARDLLAELS